MTGLVTYSVKDGNGNPLIFKAASDTSGNLTGCTSLVDVDGVPVSLALQGPQPAQLQMASMNATAMGNTTAVAAVSGQTIRVYRLVLMALSAVTVEIQDQDGAFIGNFPMQAGIPLYLPYEQEPHLTCNVGRGLYINLSAAVFVGGNVYYTQA